MPNSTIAISLIGHFIKDFTLKFYAKSYVAVCYKAKPVIQFKKIEILMKSNIDNAIIKKLLNLAKKDGIQKIVVRAVIKRGNRFLLLERALSDFLGGLVVLPGGAVGTDENILQALAREVKEETNLIVTEITTYLGSFDYASSSGKKTRQFNFLVEIEAGEIKLDTSEHSNYFLLNPSDERFSKLNISYGTKTILSKIKIEY